LIEFKRQVIEELSRYMAQDFEERFNDSDAENYHDFVEDVLAYIRRVKGDHQHIRNVDYSDVELVRRHAHKMATCILWRKHRHLEIVIKRYEIAMRTQDPALIETQSFNYKNSRRLLALHTAAEQAMVRSN
jgi:hypothetical protein